MPFLYNLLGTVCPKIVRSCPKIVPNCPSNEELQFKICLGQFKDVLLSSLRWLAFLLDTSQKKARKEMNVSLCVFFHRTNDKIQSKLAWLAAAWLLR